MKRAGTLTHSIGGDTNLLLVLAGVFSVVGVVFLIIKIGDNPASQPRLPEEARLADFAVLPPAGPWLGVDISPTEPMRQTMPTGVLVSRVMMNSPAAAAGLRAGDVIQFVGNTRTANPGDIRRAMAGYKVGDVARVTVLRNGGQQAFDVTLDSQPTATLAAVTTTGGAPWLGLDVQAIDRLMALRFGLPDTRGVIVSYVYPGSPAAAAGLSQGDVVRRVDAARIRDVNQFSDMISAKGPGTPVRLTMLRGGATQDVDITLQVEPPPNQQPPPPTLPEAEVETEAAWLGLDILPLTPAEAKEFKVPNSVKGMIVDAVAPGVGVDAGFQPGDVIVAINGTSTGTVADFQDATEGAVGAIVDVIRFGRHIYISVPPPGGVPGTPNNASPFRQVGFRTW